MNGGKLFIAKQHPPPGYFRVEIPILPPDTDLFSLIKRKQILYITSNPAEALSTFIRASRDPKGETQLQGAKSTKIGLLRPKTMPKHFLNNSKTTLKKSRKRLF